uniref:Uncharacterized protein LOC102807040 n=1 Tax=Saccoglossus kowalevskii TaxID=10224 RepID=A0ABM0MS96_SACKO
FAKCITTGQAMDSMTFDSSNIMRMKIALQLLEFYENMKQKEILIDNDTSSDEDLPQVFPESNRQEVTKKRKINHTLDSILEEHRMCKRSASTTKCITHCRKKKETTEKHYEKVNKTLNVKMEETEESYPMCLKENLIEEWDMNQIGFHKIDAINECINVMKEVVLDNPNIHDNPSSRTTPLQALWHHQFPCKYFTQPNIKDCKKDKNVESQYETVLRRIPDEIQNFVLKKVMDSFTSRKKPQQVCQAWETEYQIPNTIEIISKSLMEKQHVRKEYYFQVIQKTCFVLLGMKLRSKMKMTTVDGTEQEEFIDVEN